MADHLTPEKRSWNMSRIKGKDTADEVKVRSALFREGFRFRKNVKNLPGKPDIVLPKYRTVVFVHGCFWHRHGCKRSTTPKSRLDYWLPKFQRNIDSDIRHTEELTRLGWRVLVIWECEVSRDFDANIARLIREIREYAP